MCTQDTNAFGYKGTVMYTYCMRMHCAAVARNTNGNARARRRDPGSGRPRPGTIGTQAPADDRSRASRAARERERREATGEQCHARGAPPSNAEPGFLRTSRRGVVTTEVGVALFGAR